MTRYYGRPDVAYVPFRDAPPLDWDLIWRGSGATARVRAFAEAARETTEARGGPKDESTMV